MMQSFFFHGDMNLHEVDVLAAFMVDASSAVDRACGCAYCAWELAQDETKTTMRRSYKRPRVVAPVRTLANAWKDFHVTSSHDEQCRHRDPLPDDQASCALVPRQHGHHRQQEHPHLHQPSVWTNAMSCVCNGQSTSTSNAWEQDPDASLGRKRKRESLVRSKRFIFRSSEQIQLLLQIKALESDGCDADSPSEAHQHPTLPDVLDQSNWGWYVNPEDH